MSAQLTWLSYTTLFTCLLWAPYILDSFLKRGIMGTLGNPQDSKISLSTWAVRLKAAHYNAVENLIIVAIFTLIAELRNVDVSTLVMIYFAARVGHAIVYSLGIPLVRTVCFLTGFAMQILMFFALT